MKKQTHHTLETKNKISKIMKDKWINGEVSPKFKDNQYKKGNIPPIIKNPNLIKQIQESRRKSYLEGKTKFTNKEYLEYCSKIRKGKHNSPRTEFKKGINTWNKGKKMPQYSGEEHWNWKGGINNINDKIRKSIEYRLWRETIFKRDNYTCIWCGKIGGNLNADHIKPFSLYPELRFAIDNGRTLCKECHKKTNTYLNRGYKDENE